MRRIGWFTATLATAGVLAAGIGGLAQQPTGRPEAGGPPAADPFFAYYAHFTPQVPGAVPEYFSADGLYHVIYNVAWLAKGPVSPDGRVKVDMEPLMEVITSTVAPGTWKGRDGRGHRDPKADGPATIEPSGRDGWVDLRSGVVSLKVLQTRKAHDQLGERLDQLARLVGEPAKAEDDRDRIAQDIILMQKEVHRRLQDARAEASRDSQERRADPRPDPRPGESLRFRVETRTSPRAATVKPVSPAPVDPTQPPSADVRPGEKAPAPDRAATEAPKPLFWRTTPDARGESPEALERRLKAVEEKLDRVLKALDPAKPAPAASAAPASS